MTDSVVEKARGIVDAVIPTVRARFTSREDVVEIARALLTATAEKEAMREALEKAAEQFEFYGREHRDKAAALPGTSAVDPAYLAAHAKAETNERFGAMCRAALSAPAKGE